MWFPQGFCTCDLHCSETTVKRWAAHHRAPPVCGGAALRRFSLPRRASSDSMSSLVSKHCGSFSAVRWKTYRIGRRGRQSGPTRALHTRRSRRPPPRDCQHGPPPGQAAPLPRPAGLLKVLRVATPREQAHDHLTPRLGRLAPRGESGVTNAPEWSEKKEVARRQKTGGVLDGKKKWDECLCHRSRRPWQHRASRHLPLAQRPRSPWLQADTCKSSRICELFTEKKSLTCCRRKTKTLPLRHPTGPRLARHVRARRTRRRPRPRYFFARELSGNPQSHLAQRQNALRLLQL